jgi:hypothetical protein
VKVCGRSNSELKTHPSDWQWAARVSPAGSQPNTVISIRLLLLPLLLPVVVALLPLLLVLPAWATRLPELLLPLLLVLAPLLAPPEQQLPSLKQQQLPSFEQQPLPLAPQLPSFEQHPLPQPPSFEQQAPPGQQLEPPGPSAASR